MLSNQDLRVSGDAVNLKIDLVTHGDNLLHATVLPLWRLFSHREHESLSLCGARSGWIHSQYQRCLTDLPLARRPVRLLHRARRGMTTGKVMKTPDELAEMLRLRACG
ncbi:hypothetical protein BSZ22_01875 [Bradyrhizobium canariense]|uniref:Uncharacterized protein n=1 Tax=Bradyrhizobium canariense TaxID=255045 RepID=A0A1X3GTS2_9BRAD|nr:hypothetical protein BSZ22_01875 [Bradyrhizobium canariense]OSI82436.1 hypothetical protein BSZ23_01540 [Bradyrhizobium canariense]OSI96887.1 hypothetical protein BSZ25_01180 [Bradyrhizobium canariense]OSI98855.1 hypothetical protein BSZ24_01120 [Bradyrhizobium canariense]OSJ16290.1 hypothetical protein BSZ16_01235 [Bradyrhizobium canariense]